VGLSIDMCFEHSARLLGKLNWYRFSCRAFGIGKSFQPKGLALFVNQFQLQKHNSVAKYFLSGVKYLTSVSLDGIVIFTKLFSRL